MTRPVKNRAYLVIMVALVASAAIFWIVALKVLNREHAAHFKDNVRTDGIWLRVKVTDDGLILEEIVANNPTGVLSNLAVCYLRQYGITDKDLKR